MHSLPATISENNNTLAFFPRIYAPAQTTRSMGASVCATFWSILTSFSHVAACFLKVVCFDFSQLNVSHTGRWIKFHGKHTAGFVVIEFHQVNVPCALLSNHPHTRALPFSLSLESHLKEGLEAIRILFRNHVISHRIFVGQTRLTYRVLFFSSQ